MIEVESTLGRRNNECEAILSWAHYVREKTKKEKFKWNKKSRIVLKETGATG